MRWVALVCALLASGCFHWAPVSSLSSIEDAHVKIEEGFSSQTLVHATANGRVVEGQLEEGGRRVELDVTQSKVLVRKLNGPATAAIITASAIGLAGTVFAVVAIAVLAVSHPVFNGGGPPP